MEVAIPCNNKGRLAIGTMYWLLAKLVLHMRGQPFDMMPDLFFYREPEPEAEVWFVSY